MNANEELINKFYTAFQHKEYRIMQSCYADTAHFSDPVFPSLNSSQVKSMWEMFCKNGKDLKVDFEILNVSENTVEAQWKASYLFSATGNQVVNVIRSHFIIADNKIVEHSDRFHFYKWAKQALGATGLVFGWTSYLQNTVRKQAAKALYKYMKKMH